MSRDFSENLLNKIKIPSQAVENDRTGGEDKTSRFLQVGVQSQAGMVKKNSDIYINFEISIFLHCYISLNNLALAIRTQTSLTITKNEFQKGKNCREHRFMSSLYPTKLK